MKPTERPAQEASSSPSNVAHGPSGSGLQALSEAGRQYGRAFDRPGRSRQGSRLAVAVLTAVCVGTAVAFFGGSLYRCTATLRLKGDPDARQTDTIRRSLADFAWDHVLDEDEPADWRRGVTATSPAPGLLLVTVIASSPREGVEHASAIVHGFQGLLRERADAVRRTPGAIENALSQRRRDLQARGEAALAEVEAAVAAIPATDPSNHRETLLARWRDLRGIFSTLSGTVAATSTELATLQAAPTPTQGLVSSDARRRALEGDAMLGQDLSELSVTLSELKLHLLNVWQASSGPLAQLGQSVEDFLALEDQDAAANSIGASLSGQGLWVQAARDYRDGLAGFSETWDRRFLALKRHDVDPMAGDILDAFQRARRELNGFLFQAGRRLTTVREAVRTTLADPRNAARRHVFESSLVRRFHAVEAAHHRFEFSAGTIETPQNFRLDIALKSGRGLRRRSTERIDRIDQALRVQAAQRAVQGRDAALAAAKEKLDAARHTADATVDELLALQDELHLNSTTHEAFLRAVLKAENARVRLEPIQADLAETERALLEHSRARLIEAAALGARLVTAAANEGPVSLGDRWRPAGVGGGVAFVVVLALQSALFPRRQS